ncbi:FabD/lysophospholipase-like protein [Xylariaceae sp. AK1471]|nr:FabD/lysophospholipase-like protein [Xylariaceae sp. AK1471]
MRVMDSYYWILSLDGGGVRGLSSLIILAEIMRRVGEPPHDIFTAATGTSAGGLTALMVGRLGMNFVDCEHSFRDLSKAVFLDRGRVLNILHYIGHFGGFGAHLYDGTTMEQEVQKVLGENRKELQMRWGDGEDLKTQIPMYVVCRKVQENGELERGYVALGSHPGHRTRCKVYEAARATSAAPTYFPPQHIHDAHDGVVGGARYVDGGLGYNNPLTTIDKECESVRLQNVDKKRICYLSIGTGKVSDDEREAMRSKWRETRQQRWRGSAKALGKSAFIKFLKIWPSRFPAAELRRYVKDPDWD